MSAPDIDSRAFSEPFFERFVRAPHTLVAEGRRLTYHFPTFFRTRAVVAAFLCSRSKLDELIADDRVRTVSMLGGRSVVVFGCYEHEHVAEMGRYREAFVCVPSFVRAGPQLPVLPLVLGQRRFPGLGQLFLHMPVTSEDNRLRGVHLWGLPKTLGDIECEQDGQLRVCRVATGGEHLFTLRIPIDGRPARIAETVTLFGRGRGAFTRALSHVEGDFRVRKFPEVLLGIRRSGSRFVELGSSRAAQALASLELRPVPIEVRYAEAARLVLELPTGTQASPTSAITEVT